MSVEADYGMTETAFTAQDDAFAARYANDDKLHVTFFMHPTEVPEKTLEEGRPIYKDEEHVRIMVPGDKDSIVVRPVRDLDKQRFATRYAAFTNGEKEIQEGTPLRAWPMMSRGQVEELKHFGVTTVEQLAELADVHVAKFMALGNLKTKAQAFIALAKETAPLEQLNAAVEAKDAEIAALQQAVEEQAEAIKELQKPKRAKAS